MEAGQTVPCGATGQAGCLVPPSPSMGGGGQVEMVSRTVVPGATAEPAAGLWFSTSPGDQQSLMVCVVVGSP